jgi:hypothetical protein
MFVYMCAHLLSGCFATRSCDKVKDDEVDGACSTHGGDDKCINVLDGKPEGKRPLGRPKRSWEDNIRTDLREIVWGRCGLEPSGSGEGPVAAHGNEPSGSIKDRKILDCQLLKKDSAPWN